MNKYVIGKNRIVIMNSLAVFVALIIFLLLFASSAMSMGHDGVERLFGANRWATSANVALEAYPDGSASVIIARGDDAGGWADGLAGGYLAGVLDAPILLTAPNTLPVPVQAAIGTLGATKAYILGGTGAVSAGVEAELVALGLDIERIAGANREATAAEIAGMGTAVDTAFVVQGRAPADSMVAGAAAFAKGYPILLVGQDSVPAVTETAITSLGIENIIIVGGSGVVSTGVATKLGNIPGVTSVTRLSGVNRETTSVEFAKGQFPDCANFSIVNGRQGLADAVGSSVFGNPILYVQTDTVPAVVGSYLEDMVTCESMIYIFGGGAVVSAAVEAEIQAIKDDAVCLKIAEVSDADELYDALLDQCDYDVIRLVADIDEDVNYTVRLACDDLIFDLNGYKLGLDPGYDFQVTADNITITGSEIDIPNGKFDADTGGGITLTIDGVKFVVDGNFDISADYDGVVSRVDITDSVFNVGGRFYYDIDDDFTEGTLNITRSEFNLGGDFYFDADDDWVVSRLDITDSVFNVGGSFLYDCDYDFTEGTLNSTRSEFNLGGRFYVEFDDDGVKGTANISDSKFVIGDVDHTNNFWIDADGEGVIVDITITNTEFDLGDSNLRIETSRAAEASILLENITFTSLGKLYIEGDTEVNGATFKEDAGTVVFEWREDHTLILNGDIVLDHEDNVLELTDMDEWSSSWAAQIKGNAVVSGEGKVDIAQFSNDDSGIFDIVFETKVEINDAVTLSNVTLAETLVNSDFNVFRTVTLTDDMVLGANVTIYAERAPLPLSEEVKVRGTLVGEGDITIDGGANSLTLQDKLMLKNLSLTNLNVWVANGATVVFEDMVLHVGALDFEDGAKLLLASDLLITDDIAIASLFTNDEGVFDGDGYSVLTDNNAVMRFDGSLGGTVKNIIFELEVFFVGENYIFEEVIFNKDFTVVGDALMMGGGWAADATVTVDDSTLTFGAGQAKVNNAGNLVLVNGGAVAFVTDEATDLEYPL